MDFLKVLQNKNFGALQQQQQPVRTQAPKPTAQKAQAATPKAAPAAAKAQPKANEQLSCYKVKSSKGKEFNRRRKQTSSEFYDMPESNLLKAYD